MATTLQATALRLSNTFALGERVAGPLCVAAASEQHQKALAGRPAATGGATKSAAVRRSPAADLAALDEHHPQDVQQQETPGAQSHQACVAHASAPPEQHSPDSVLPAAPPLQAQGAAGSEAAGAPGAVVAALSNGDCVVDRAMHESSDAYSRENYARVVQLCQPLYLAGQLRRTDLLLLLGAAHYQLGNYEQCVACNDQCILLDPSLAEAYANLANALQQLGSTDLALLYYQSALRLRPTFTDAISNMAAAYLQKGLVLQAMEAYDAALAISPALSHVRASLGDLWRLQGESGRGPALACYSEALRRDPACAAAWRGLGDARREAGDCTQAAACYQEAVRLQPRNADALTGLGVALRDLGRREEAEAALRAVVALRPQCALALGNLAGMCYDQVVCVAFEGACDGGCGQLWWSSFCGPWGAEGRMEVLPGRLNSTSPWVVCQWHEGMYLASGGGALFLTGLARALHALLHVQGKLDEAISAYQQAIAAQPHFPEAWNNLGNALREAGRAAEAITCYTRCIHLQMAAAQAQAPLLAGGGPGAAKLVAAQHAQRLSVAFNNLAGILKMTSRLAECIQCYEHVMYLQPQSPEAYANLASAYKDCGRHDEAISSYRQALSLRPSFPDAHANLVHSLQCVCEWGDRPQLFARLEVDVRRDIAEGRLPSVQPFHAMAYPFPADLALAISKQYAQHCLTAAQRLGVPRLAHPPAHRLAAGQRLRVGYVSSDYGNHPLSHLMGAVFGMHDRSRIEVFCYSLAPSDGSEWRARIEAEAEHFVDVSTWSAADVARRISADGVQIAVNLNGYTKGARNEVFALQPAPVQASYLGFPATMGASFIPWLIIDKTVCPPSSRCCYSESIAFMPHSYFANDYKQAHPEVLLPANLPSRAEVGLPEGKVVYSCANQLYKMDPQTFDTWCSILRRVPHSVLWLLRFPPMGEARVKAEAAARGVDPDRVVFTDVAAKPLHIRRSGVADLFLDTPLCNAHTTGCDVLWGGCPMVTLPLERMASRVAASLCTATGLAREMVVGSHKEYEDKAVELGLDHAKRQSLRQRLQAARLTCPLFDTAGWVRDFERCLLRMWDIHCEGGGPRDFDV